MPALFWTGKLSLPIKLLVNANNLLALITGNARDTTAMKNRVRQGYDGIFSKHVARYDELGELFQTKAATAQLNGMELRGKEILDVGCGTGIMSLLALGKGAARIVCGDISRQMLDVGRAKAEKQGHSTTRISFCELDAECLPFDDASFDVVMTGMTLGLLPDPEKAVAEMCRVLRPGGLLSVGAHGPEHYWEACDASFRAIKKQYVLGYRLEFWPRKEKAVLKLLAQAGITDIEICRIIWRNKFKSGEDAYDFFAAISSNWWYAKVPPGQRDAESRKAREFFGRKQIVQVTDDIIIASGRKP